MWFQGKASGRLCAVRFRAWEQKCLERLGRSIHRKTHVFFLPLLLGLGVLLAGFKAFDKNSQFDQLWVECKLFQSLVIIIIIIIINKLCTYNLYSGRPSGNGIALFRIGAWWNRKRHTFVGHTDSQRGYFSGSASTAASS